MRRVAPGLFVALLFASTIARATWHTAQAAEEHPSAAAQDGATLFRERGCVQCHQLRGSGGTKGPDLSGVGRRLKKEAIQTQIVGGGGAMPAFGNALPKQEIATLVEYLHRQKEKLPKSPKTAAAVQAESPTP